MGVTDRVADPIKHVLSINELLIYFPLHILVNVYRVEHTVEGPRSQGQFRFMYTGENKGRRRDHEASVEVCGHGTYSVPKSTFVVLRQVI